MSYKISIIQNAPTLNRDKNISLSKDIINEHKNSDLIIFPELCLNGYSLMDGFYDYCFSKKDIIYHFKDIKQDIIISCALSKKGKIYNCAIYLSKGKIAHIHYKNNLPNHTMFEEARFFAKGNKIKSFKSKFGKMAMIVCEDLWDNKTIHKLSAKKAKIIVVISASPTRGFEENGLLIQKQWYNLLESLSVATKAFVFFVNRVGFEDGLGFWGGSRVLSPSSEVLANCKIFQKDSITVEI